MAAPENNSFWEQRSSHGRDPIFETPTELWEAAEEYFRWVESNPLYEQKIVVAGAEPHTVEVPKMRAMTLRGLCIFLDISRPTFDEYAKRQGFSYICDAIRNVIFTQKFEGAAAGLLNANLIARDLGIAEKHEAAGNLTIKIIDRFGNDRDENPKTIEQRSSEDGESET